MVEQVLQEKEIEDVSYEKVSEGLTLDGEEIKIAPRKPELDRDAKVEIDTSPDQMKAFLSYYPPLGGDALSITDILKKLDEEGIVTGVKEEELKDKFNPEQKLEDFVIAVGKEPIPGEDGRIELKFNLDQKENKVVELDDGSVDFYNLNRIVNVKEGEVLATKIPAVEGKPGQKVTGEEIPPSPVERVELPQGENVKTTQDGLALVAEIDGQVMQINDRINVLQVYTVEGDVDLTTGNIDFNGNVIVKGNIRDNMEIKAEGSIQVNGSVYSAKLEAEGQIIIQQGFIARNKGLLKAEGDIIVEFIENGIVEGAGNLVVNNAIMHSQIDVDQKITVTEKKGLIVGGEVRATQEIEANIIGSDLDATTKVSVGVSPELRDEFKSKEQLYVTKKERLDEIIKAISVLKKKDQLSDEKKRLLKQLTRQKYTAAADFEELSTAREELLEKLEQEKEGMIKVKNTIYPGVIITIGTTSSRINKPKSNVKYYLEDEEIKTASLV
nr:FapA family protein [Natroniella sulfidigena]